MHSASPRRSGRRFAAALERADLDSNVDTRTFVEEFLRDALGYGELQRVDPFAVGERRYPIDVLASGALPVVIAPHTLDLDDPAPSCSRPKVAAPAKRVRSSCCRSSSTQARTATGAWSRTVAD